MELVVLI